MVDFPLTLSGGLPVYHDLIFLVLFYNHSQGSAGFGQGALCLERLAVVQ